MNKVTFPATSAKVSPEIASAWTSGVEASQAWWREKVLALITTAGGGARGFAACRREGRCEREPQRTLEDLIESVSVLECRAAPSDEPDIFPASQLLLVLAQLLRTPDFQPIHIRRAELNRLVVGIRALQTAARSATSSIERLGKLNYDDLDRGSLGTAITLLCATRDSLKELLK